MPAPATDPGPGRTPTALAGAAGLACVACCLLPALIAAGVLGGSATALANRLPTLAVSLAVLAGAVWWFQRRRRSRSCRFPARGGCTCAHRAPESDAHR